MPIYLDISFDGRGIRDDNRAAAEAAIIDALKARGATDNAEARAILADEDAATAIMDAGTRALTAGWHDPNGAYVSGITA